MSSATSTSIEFFNTSVSDKAKELVREVLETGWLSEGRRVREFEEALHSQLGVQQPVALNSGTSALHLALVVAGVKAGDEVILPAQTFVATGLAILMVGAVPVFADVDPMTGNISPESIEEKITDRTTAVMPVHWAGLPCEMDEIQAIAERHNLTVIEDAAHALGAQYRGRPIGAISDFTAFSFQAIKHLTSGDGGALCSLRPDHKHSAMRLRWFGIDRANSIPSILGEREFDITELGYKYHMNDYAAALALGNLHEFNKQFMRRQQIGALYRQELDQVPGLQLLRLNGEVTHAYWLFTLLVEERERFIRRLQHEGIPASVVHLRIDRYSLFGGVRDDLQGQAEFDEQQVAIPVHSALRDDDVEKIVRTIKDGW